MAGNQTRRRFLAALGGTAFAAAASTAAVASTDPGRPEARGDGTGAAGDLPSRRTVAVDGFHHRRIDDRPPSPSLGFTGVEDLTGNGRPDVIIAGKGAPTNLWLFGTRTGLPSRSGLRHAMDIDEPTLFWYENPGWRRHAIASVPHLSEGGAFGDLNGNGRRDLVIGQSLHYRTLFWFEQPANPRDSWTTHRITEDFENYHDVAVADVDDDGLLEVVGLSQQSKTLFYYDIPDDPYQSQWPRSNRHEVMTGTNTKGLEILDIDGDGRTEIVAGNSIYHRQTGGGWRRERFTTGFEQPRIEVADLDGDGELEIVIAEGDSPWLGTHPGRLAWFDPPEWEPRVLHPDLFCPHSLAVTDFTGDDRPDIFVGEMGLGENDDPALYLHENRGGGGFEQRVISRGIPTHEATVADLEGDGSPDIVGKSYRPDSHVDAWFNPW